MKREDVIFHEYYLKWIKKNKVGFVREVTLKKYMITHKRLAEIAPTLTLKGLTRQEYQIILNRYAETHEKQTTSDFHCQLKACIMDTIADGLIKKDPTYKAVIRGKMVDLDMKKKKYLGQQELNKLLYSLELGETPNWDWFIFLLAKTGMRFAEALAITPNDFDLKNKTLRINKSWDYKQTEGGGFIPTKNVSSNRVIDLDVQTIRKFNDLLGNMEYKDRPIFETDDRVFNSTVNDHLAKKCKNAGVTPISIHGLRHTHASLLIFAGVSIPSIAKRLGHANTTTTQLTYIHIIEEMENQDKYTIITHLAGIG